MPRQRDLHVLEGEDREVARAWLHGLVDRAIDAPGGLTVASWRGVEDCTRPEDTAVRRRLTGEMGLRLKWEENHATPT